LLTDSHPQYLFGTPPSVDWEEVVVLPKPLACSHRLLTDSRLQFLFDTSPFPVPEEQEEVEVAQVVAQVLEQEVVLQELLVYIRTLVFGFRPQSPSGTSPSLALEAQVLMQGYY
jgi:hypothetical protein